MGWARGAVFNQFTQAMTYSEDTPTGGVCQECGYKDGHNVEACPLVLNGKAKLMPGLPPEAVERLRTADSRR
jgi:hypothetical protein